MEITLIIVVGVVATTLIAALADHFTKTKLARSAVAPQELEALRNRIAALEHQVQDQDAKVQRLEADVSFTAKLLEKKE